MSTRTVLGMALLVAAAAAPAGAQAPPGGPGGPPDFAQMRQQFIERMKEMLAVNDEEWKALEPRIEKVQQLSRDANARGGMFFMFGPGGPGGPGGGPGGRPPGGPDANRPPSEVRQKMEDLRTALDNKDAKPDEIKAKLQALRDARAQAKADLTKAQDDLRELLTSRQEAVLVMMGILE